MAPGKREQRIQRERLASISYGQDQLDRSAWPVTSARRTIREERRQPQAPKPGSRELLNGCAPHPTYGLRD
jgi:hypothetical protein